MTLSHIPTTARLPRPTRPGAWLCKYHKDAPVAVCDVRPSLLCYSEAGSDDVILDVQDGLWLPLVPECEVEEAFKAGWIKGRESAGTQTTAIAPNEAIEPKP